MLRFLEYYRKVGVMTPNQFGKPRTTSIVKFNFPMSSALHRTEGSEEGFDLDRQDPLFVNTPSNILVSFQTNYEDYRTMPGIMSAMRRPMNIVIQGFFNSHKEFRNLDRNKSLGNEVRNVLVYDYSTINNLYRYRPMPYAGYQQWNNSRLAVVSKIKEVDADLTRNHFIEIHVPAIIPPYSIWRLVDADYSKNYDRNGVYLRRSLLNVFKSNDLFDIMDLWLFLGENRSKSHWGEFTPEQLDKVNIIFRAGSRFSLLNLGMLRGWIKTSSETDVVENATLEIPIAQRRFLGLLMTISSTRTLGNVDEEEVDNDPDSEETLELYDDSPEATRNLKINASKMPVGDTAIAVDTSAANPNGDKADTKGKVVSKDGVVAVGTDADNLNQDIADSLDGEIEKDIEQLEFIYKQAEINELEAESDHYDVYTPPTYDPVEAVMEAATEKATAGQLSAAEFRRFSNKATRFTQIPDPFGSEASFGDAIAIKEGELDISTDRKLIPDSITVVDKSMLSSSLEKLDSQYIKTTMHKDIGHTVLALQRCGIIIDNYAVNHVEDINESYDEHVIKLLPVTGQPSTLKFRLPAVDADGTFKASGVQYRMRRQIGDLPIRKIKPNQVALTSYFSKIFVSRSERSNFDYSGWLAKKVIQKAVDIEDKDILDLVFTTDEPPADHIAPRAYTALAARIAYFRAKGYEFNFSRSKIDTWFPGLTVKDCIPVARGLVEKEIILVLDDDGILHQVKPGAKMELVGRLEDFLGIEADPPVDMAEVGMLGKNLPLGLVLGYAAGLGSLLKTINAQYRVVKRGVRLNLEGHEFAVRFEDESLVFTRKQPIVAMLMSGFNRFSRDVKMYSRYDFDKKDVYGAVFDNNGLSSRKVREIDFIFTMWVDPITLSYLQQQKLPTDMMGIFLKSVELLTTDLYFDQVDISQMRNKGYERFSGMVYAELIKSLRGYRSKPNSANATVSLNPLAVWMNIIQDQTVTPVEQSNPIQALKDTEVVVFRGAGGRDSRSMTAPSRKFHPNGMGVFSEAGVDNGDVGTIAYTSADPNYDSVRGTTTRIDPNDVKSSQIISTSMLLAPGADMDQPVRVNFINIQNSQTTHCVGYTPMPLRTGYESMMAHRTPSIHARTAKQPGVVESLNAKCIIIANEDGSKESYELGRRFGKWSGKVMPHNLVTSLKVGDKLTVGQPIIFNTNYFQQNQVNPGEVIFKTYALARTVLMENADTLEDSCAISKDFCKDLITTGTYIRNLRVKFTEEVQNLVKIGELVESDSILCTVYEPLAGMSDAYNDEALGTLKEIGSMNPTAKHAGVIEKIEVIYCGDPEEMTETLRTITDASDSTLYKQNKQMKKPVIDGGVAIGFRVDNIPISTGTAVIKVYITASIGMGIGDKVVFANQMKSTVGRVMTAEDTTLDGQRIDAIFGYDSLLRRVVLSAEFMGTTNTLLKALGKQVVAIYES